MNPILQAIQMAEIQAAATDNDDLNFAINVVHRRMELTIEANQQTQEGKDDGDCKVCMEKRPEEYQACKDRVAALSLAGAAVMQALEHYVEVANKDYTKGDACK